MRRQVTKEQFDAIMRMVPEVTMTPQEVNWGPHPNLPTAKAIYTHITGRKAKLSNNCTTCHLDLWNELLQAAGLPVLGKKVSEGRAKERMDICKACPAFHSNTKSCGRLGADLLDPKPVMIDGTPVNPCGCFLPVKILFKFTTCPANKWPTP